MKHREETKRTLIDATKQLIILGGGFTVKDISEAAYTNVAAINYYFGDKTSLVSAALSELLDELKSKTYESFNRDFEDSQRALEDVLEFLLVTYSEYKGAVRYIMLSEDPINESKLIEKFFFDRDFFGTFVDKLSNNMGETDPNMLFYKIYITISAFLLPIMIEGKTSSKDDKISLSALTDEENRKAFIATLMLMFR